MTLSIFEKKVNSVSHITHDEIFLPENLRNVYVDITQHGKILVSGNTIQKNGQDYEYKYVVYLLNEHLDIEDTFEIFIKNYELKDFVFEDSKFGAAEYTAMFTDQKGSYFYQSYDENFVLISEPKPLNQQLVDQYIIPQVYALDIDWNYSDEIVILHVHNVQGEYEFNTIEGDLVYYLDYNSRRKVYYLSIEEMNNKEDRNILLHREVVSLDSLDYVYWGIAKDDFSEPSHLVLFDAFGDNPNSSDIYDFGSADKFSLTKVTGSVFDKIGQIRNYSIAETENDEAVVAYSSWDGHNTLVEKSSFEYVNTDLTLRPLLVGQRIWADLRSFELENVKGILWQSSSDEGMTWEEVYYTFAGRNFDQSYYVSKNDLNSIIRYTVDLYSGEDVVSLNSGRVLTENYVPEIISEAVTAAKEDIVYNYDILTSDFDVNDIVEISIKTKPDWLSFDAGTGVLSGTPTNDEVGDHSVVLRATDGAGAYAEQSFTVSVSNVNDDPIVTSSALTSIDEDASYSYTFVASDIDVSDTLTLSAEVIPDWLNFDADTGVLTGVPSNDDIGDHSILLRATDAAGAYAEQEFSVSVNEKNHAPTFSSPKGPLITGISATNETIFVHMNDLEDINGITDVTFEYQWFADDVEIEGANNPSYKITDQDIETTIGVRVTYTDNGGFKNSIYKELDEPISLGLGFLQKSYPWHKYTDLDLNLATNQIGERALVEASEKYVSVLLEAKKYQPDNVDNGLLFEAYTLSLLKYGLDGDLIANNQIAESVEPFGSIELGVTSDGQYIIVDNISGKSVYDGEKLQTVTDVVVDDLLTDVETSGFDKVVTLNESGNFRLLGYPSDGLPYLIINTDTYEKWQYGNIFSYGFSSDESIYAIDTAANSDNHALALSRFPGGTNVSLHTNIETSVPDNLFLMGQKVYADLQSFVINYVSLDDLTFSEYSRQFFLEREVTWEVSFDEGVSWSKVGTGDYYEISESDIDGRLRYTISANDLDVVSTMSPQIEAHSQFLDDWTLLDGSEVSLPRDLLLLEAFPEVQRLTNESYTEDEVLDSFHWRLFADGSQIFSGKGREPYTLTQNEVGKDLSASVYYQSDDQYFELPSIGTVANINDPPEGRVIIDWEMTDYPFYNVNINDFSDRDGFSDVKYVIRSSDEKIIHSRDGYLSRPSYSVAPHNDELTVYIEYTDDFGADEKFDTGYRFIFYDGSETINISSFYYHLYRLGAEKLSLSFSGLGSGIELILGSDADDPTTSIQEKLKLSTSADISLNAHLSDAVDIEATEFADSMSSDLSLIHVNLQGGDDTISLTSSAGRILGGSGNDTIALAGNGTYGSGFAAGNISSSLQTGTEERISLNGKTRFEDVMDGGADVDTVILTDASDAFFLHDSFSGFHSSLTLSNDYEGRSGTARIENIENINAGAGDDIIDLTSPDYSLAGQNITVNGGEGSDTLWGSDADETLIGGTDNDVLFGGAGVNELIGGSGADEFQFTKTSTHDTIDDFSISDGDTLKFFNTGGAQFDRVSIALNSEGDELFIAYGSGLNDMLTISLPNAGLHLDELTSDVLIIV